MNASVSAKEGRVTVTGRLPNTPIAGDVLHSVDDTCFDAHLKGVLASSEP